MEVRSIKVPRAVLLCGGSSAGAGRGENLTRISRGLSVELSRVPEGVSSVKPQGLGRDRSRATGWSGWGSHCTGKRGAGQPSPPTQAPDLLSEAQFP